MTGRFKVIFSSILMRVVEMEIHKGHNCCSPDNHRSVHLINCVHCCHGDTWEQYPIILRVLARWGPGCFPFLACGRCFPSSWYYVMVTVHLLSKFPTTACINSKMKWSGRRAISKRSVMKILSEWYFGQCFSKSMTF